MRTLPSIWDYPPQNLITQTIGIEGKRQYALHAMLPSDPEQWAVKISA